MVPNLRRVLVVGATGAVGMELLRQLDRDESVGEIAVVVRRALAPELKLKKVREYVMNFDRLDSQSDAFQVEAVFCALGTTIKTAGSQENFRKVDHDYPLNVAKAAQARGAKHFLVVSAIGADSESRFFYNQVKGDVEKDLKNLKFEYLTIVRPSVMIRPGGEWRFGEVVGQKIAALLPKAWRSVHVRDVAKAMIDAFKSPVESVRVIRNQELFS